MHSRLVIFAWLVLLLLGGCSSGGAPVVDLYSLYSHNQPPSRPVTSGSYVVRSGDTLYSIAYRHSWNFRELAAANGIKSPYTIYPGQRISFAKAVPKASAPAPSRQGTSRPASTATTTTTRAPAPPPPIKLPSGQPQWRWPTAGPVLSGYGSKDSLKGIMLGGAKGAPVFAAADGVVVYRGNEVKGYGNLLIIKHSEIWLSAYAHNDNLLVQEGSTVKAGQKIATLGDSGTWRTQLYFETRKSGTPVNPQTVLPKR